LTFKTGLDNGKVNQDAQYLGPKSFSSKLLFIHTDAPNWLLYRDH